MNNTRALRCIVVASAFVLFPAGVIGLSPVRASGGVENWRGKPRKHPPLRRMTRWRSAAT